MRIRGAVEIEPDTEVKLIRKGIIRQVSELRYSSKYEYIKLHTISIVILSICILSVLLKLQVLLLKI